MVARLENAADLAAALLELVEADRATFRRELARMASSNEPVAFECRVHREGGTGWVACRGRRMASSTEGEPVVYGVLLDLTSGKRTEDATTRFVGGKKQAFEAFTLAADADLAFAHMAE